MKTIAVVLVILLTPVKAAAQEEVHRSFDELSRAGRLAGGDVVWILADLAGAGEYRELNGRLAGLTQATIIVLVETAPAGATDLAMGPEARGYSIVLPEGRVRRIDAEFADPLTNGMLIGAAVGFATVAIPVLVWAASCESFCFFNGGAALLLGAGAAGTGVAVGASVDAAIKTRGVVYSAPGLSSARIDLSISPIITRERRGVLFTLGW